MTAADPTPGRDEWRAALDAFAAGVDAHRKLLETGGEQASSPWPPPSLPTSSVPNEFHDEALALLAAARELTDAMGRQLAGLPMRRARGKTPRKPSQATWSTVL